MDRTEEGAALVPAYLARIGHAGPVAPDLATLVALHRRHVQAIAWENLDVPLGRPLSRDPVAAWRKIVERGRGGWCYEMNGLFALMLEAIGFRVTRLTAGVMREQNGDFMVGNHLTTIVHLDRDYLADVGIGSGLIEPVPLAEGSYRQDFMTFRLERLESGWWRLHNHPGVIPPSFDFSPDFHDEVLLDERCAWLQTDPGSPFRRSAVVHRHSPGRLESLVGGEAIAFTAVGRSSEPIGDAEDFAGRLATLGLDVPEILKLWPAVAAPPTANI